MAVTEFSYLGTYLNEKDLRRLNKMLMPEII
jgi:hypothetical protein